MAVMTSSPLHPTQCVLRVMSRELSHLFLMDNSPGLCGNPHGNLFASAQAGIAFKHLALSLLGFVWRYVPKSFRPLKRLFPSPGTVRGACERGTAAHNGERRVIWLLVFLPAGVTACSSPNIPNHMINIISAVKILYRSQKCLKNLLQH